MDKVEQFLQTGKTSFKEFAPNSKNSYRRHIKDFEIFLLARGKSSIEQASENDLRDYLQSLQGLYSPRSIPLKIYAVNAYLRWLERQTPRLCLSKFPPIPKPQLNFMEVDNEKLEKMLQNMQGNQFGRIRDKAIFALILRHGFKTSHINKINCSDVDLVRITIMRKHLESLPLEIVAWIDARKENGYPLNFESDTPFFLNKHGERISARSIRRRIMDYAGINAGFTMRNIRHTYLKNLRKGKERPIFVH